MTMATDNTEKTIDVLSNYLQIVATEGGGVPSGSFSSNGRALSLKVPLSQWPENLKKVWKQELFYLLPEGSRSGRLDGRDCVVLCHEVSNCERKCVGNEDRGCSFYNRGICIMATTMANNFRPLSFGTIGAFNGISKQRVQQIYCAAQKKVIRAAARDPVLREYYSSIGLRSELMPDPKQLASKIEELIVEN